MKVDPLGLPSRTGWRVRGRGANAEGKPVAWLELEPHTGHTHQLRVHCAAMGWPIAGDPIYGTETRVGDGTSLHLLARGITIPLYKNKEPVECTASVPPHMQALLERCGWSGEAADSSVAPALIED